MRDNELFIQLVIAHCEYESYAQIIYELEELHKYDDEYWQIWNLYIMASSIYKTIKKQFFVNEVFMRVKHDYKSWEIDYINYELRIYLKEDKNLNKEK